MNKILYFIKRLIPKKLFTAAQPAYHFVLSWFSALVYRRPSEKLIVIGVTGTTGKTTSTYLIAKTLEGAGLKVGYTSTAMFHDGKREWLNNKKMTMPGRFFTQAILNRMVKNGCQYAVVETTSEGVRQFRHRFINYDVLVFTGLYPEHIESHGGFENYKNAKGELFKHLKRCKTKYVNEKKAIGKITSNIKKLDLNRVKKTIIANLDDEHVDYFLGHWSEEKYGYTLKSALEFKDVKVLHYGNIAMSQAGITFQVEREKFAAGLLGEFNATNSMNAIGVALSQGLSLGAAKDGLAKISGVPGRLERIDEGQNFSVIVDYAFEPNAVAKLYETVSLIPHNRVIQILGSTGGGRDISRRPILGRLAGERADVVIVTNEDPYDENPEIIIDQVVVGAEKGGKVLGENLFRVLDRREAIAKALTLAEAGDLVLITGKGSEQGICVADGKILPWDDRQAVREELRLINKK